MYIHSKQIIYKGASLDAAQKAIIMIHGRGGSPQDIVSLERHLDIRGFAIVAPGATNSSWYPYSFMAPVSQNQPALDSALELIDEAEKEINAKGIVSENIYWLGFSQGACLTLEYTARNAKKYGGIVALTGGLIGSELNTSNYKGDFAGTQILVTTSDPDLHVPIGRVQESISILEDLNANVTSEIYKGKPHTISAPEIEIANRTIFT